MCSYYAVYEHMFGTGPVMSDLPDTLLTEQRDRGADKEAPHERNTRTTVRKTQ